MGLMTRGGGSLSQQVSSHATAYLMCPLSSLSSIPSFSVSAKREKDLHEQVVSPACTAPLSPPTFDFQPSALLLRLLRRRPRLTYFPSRRSPKMETYTLPYMPTELSQIHVRLFKNVSNAKDLRAGLIAAATMEGEAGDLERDKYDYCFVEAKTVRCSLL